MMRAHSEAEALTLAVRFGPVTTRPTSFAAWDHHCYCSRMPIAGKFSRLELHGPAACFLMLGCGDADDSRPPDVQGSLETALQLVFGADGQIQPANANIDGEEATLVELCLTPDGACIPGDYRADECYRYDDIQAFIDGVEIPLVWSGGWTSEPIFEPLPSGGNGHGCSYPLFDTFDLGVDARSSSHEITIRVGEEEVSFSVENWLLGLSGNAPDTFVKGTEIFVSIEPRMGTEEEGTTAINFVYDNLDHNDPDKVLHLGIVEPEAWQDDGFLLLLPATM